MSGGDPSKSDNSRLSQTSLSDGEPNGKMGKKDIYVPVPPKKRQKEATNEILKEAVSAFYKFASVDPCEAFIHFMKEDNERNWVHEKEMAEMQLKMLQTSMMEPFQKTYQYPVDNQQGIHVMNNGQRSFTQA